MKKITALLAIFLISLSSYGQDEVNTSFASEMNTIFGQLDKTRIPHAILLDYGMEFTNVPAYNGTLTDSTYSSATSLKQIYKTLLSSRITATTPDMITPVVFDANWNNHRTEGVISLCGLYYKYSQIIQNATTNNKITYTGGKFYDKTINGVWQNPYEVLQTFVMASAIEQYDQLSFQVQLPSELFYSNQNSAISSIAIDFDNGQGYQTITMGQTVTVAYSTTGMKTWKYKLSLTDGTSLYNQSQIQIGNDDGTFTELPLPLPPVCETCRSSTTTTLSCTNNLCYGRITASTAYLGKYGKVKITVDYANPGQGIQKPLIVAEGFDLGVVLNPEKAYGSNTYSGTFVKSLINSGTTLRNLIYENYKQYDIIYVDWDNGVDYMQRNAYALEEVIEWVNAQKAASGSTTKNVVLGQSMGGVISRYALADMEQRGIDHQTSLFISHDAPQQGANIPISLQYMYRHLTKQYLQVGYAPLGGLVTIPILEEVVGVSDYLSILDAPASRQLLKNSINLDYSVSTTYHTNFYDELKNIGLPNSGGYPTLCRNIALSNGSECGETQNFVPGDDIVNFTYNKGLSFWGDLFSMIYVPIGGSIGGTFLNPKLYSVGALGLVPGHSKFNVNFISRALYDSSGSEIYKGKISYTKKIAWLFNVTINLTDVSKNQPSGILPLDTYGGGYYDTKIVAGSVNLNGLYIRDRFSFIPTTSALDIGKRDVILDDSDYKKSYVGAVPLQAPKNSPFINYITDFDKSNPNSNKNKSHISFNSRNGDWLAAELNAINNSNLSPELSNCSYMCGGSTGLNISGNNFICSATSGNYSVPGGAPYYNWTITQGESLVSFTGNGTSNIVLTALPNKSGQVTISLTMGDNTKCGFQSLMKTIWVGKPLFNVPRAPSEEESCDSKYHYIKYIITNRQPSETYSIQVFTTGVRANFIANDRIQFNVPKGFSGLLEFSVVGTNSCGSTSYSVENLIYPCGTNNNTAKNISISIYPKQTENIDNTNSVNQNIEVIREDDVQVESLDLTGELKKTGNDLIYPNPTNGFFKISLDKKSDGILLLTNMEGVVIYKGDFKNQDELDVDIQNQPSGIYAVNLVIGGQQFVKKVIKKY